MGFSLLSTMIKKDRFSISMDKELVKKLDEEVEGGRYGSRSQAIEACVKQKYKLEDIDERVSGLIVELMELAAKSPEFVEMYKKALKNV
jgi:metal-responsive CopG/Arc/MetJ family transcriptional regulator